MRKSYVVAAAPPALIGLAGAASPISVRVAAQPAPPTAAANDLRPASDFAAIADERARALALFAEAGRVLMHPRCVNCHPAGDSPHQTDRMRLHQPLVVRGADGHGAPTLPCNTCHGPRNFEPAHVPGHPEWHLAPASMAWEGRSLGQICEQIKDRACNGGRDRAGLVFPHTGGERLYAGPGPPAGGAPPPAAPTPACGASPARGAHAAPHSAA